MRWFPIFFIGVFLLSAYCFVDAHELTHQKIYSAYGIESSYEITLFDIEHSGLTTPEETTMPLDEYRQMESLHAINELVSYQYNVMFCFIALMTLVIFYGIEERK